MATPNGGLTVADVADPTGALVVAPGLLQFGRLAFGGSTPARWIKLTNWRSRPTLDLTDTPYPDAHGERAGTMLAQGVIVTFDTLLRGTVDDQSEALDTIDQLMPVSNVEQAFVVDDGRGPEYRMARVIDLDYPQDWQFRAPGPLPVTIAFKCVDPRRYSLTERTATLGVPTSDGGLEYPLDYDPGLDYGTSSGGAVTVNNAGNTDAPVHAVLQGPLTNPRIQIAGKTFQLDIVLTADDTLTIDGRDKSVLLNDTADRSQYLTDNSALLSDFTIAPGNSSANLTAASGTGSATFSWHDARM